ncbi:hypothetical protein QVD17_01272 [Tagetes erecta]|uniref:Uncharacterized protein n=1 Tax=Tagetes erecta TaxID=13708 RepID=A0AAD8LBU2_TARER|nr:hypothetical protein QVD17_01272 [Tagetes erecta]
MPTTSSSATTSLSSLYNRIPLWLKILLSLLFSSIPHISLSKTHFLSLKLTSSVFNRFFHFSNRHIFFLDLFSTSRILTGSSPENLSPPKSVSAYRRATM